MTTWILLLACLIAVSNAQKLIKGGKTSQSTTYTYGNIIYSSERAIDGVFNQCAITELVNNSWWNNDLLGLYDIYNITIYNIDDHNTNMDKAEIRIGNSSETNGLANNRCTTIKNFTTNANNTFQCDNGSMWGRYVTIYLPRGTSVIVCEVRIYGTRKDLKLIRENKTWEESLTYCRDHDMELAFILDNETQTWAALEAAKSDSPFVWLGLRYTCTLDFWFWVGNHPLTFTNWKHGQNQNACDMSVAMKTNGTYSWYSKPDNETFNFICRI